MNDRSWLKSQNHEGRYPCSFALEVDVVPTSVSVITSSRDVRQLRQVQDLSDSFYTHCAGDVGHTLGPTRGAVNCVKVTTSNLPLRQSRINQDSNPNLSASFLSSPINTLGKRRYHHSSSPAVNESMTPRVDAIKRLSIGSTEI